MNFLAVAYIRSQLAAQPAWQEFERRRRTKTLAAIAAMSDDACDQDLTVDQAASKHIDKILEAALPIDDLADLLGTDGLAALAAALREKGA